MGKNHTRTKRSCNFEANEDVVGDDDEELIFLRSEKSGDDNTDCQYATEEVMTRFSKLLFSIFIRMDNHAGGKMREKISLIEF